ncbi:hypothetical protein BMS3Abin03_01983 [bacterium BMS3Abin03]|nr:hypothetical protein BMS3Abin03_01983 [bacterium BMS3Abin03]
MSPRSYKKHRKSENKLGYWMRNRFAIHYERHIQALVYVGAAFLVIVVGLRGLGNLSDVSFIPAFILNDDGKIESNIIMIALVIEFSMLCLLAAVSYFAPSEENEDLQSSIDSLSSAVQHLSQTIPSEIAEQLIGSAQKTASAAETLLTDGIEILNGFRSKLDKRIVQIDQDIIQVRQNIAQNVINTSSQLKSFIEKEKVTIKSFHQLVEKLIIEAKTTLNNVSKNVSEDIKKTFDTTESVISDQKEMIDKFYSINAKLLSESRESFNNFINNYSKIVEHESNRLEWLSSNQLRPEEFMNNLNKTNEHLVTHLKNIDNTLKIIMNGLNGVREGSGRKKSFFRRIKPFKKRELLDETS